MLRNNLNPKLFSKDCKTASTRDGYGRGLVKAGERNKNVVVLCADVAESTRSHLFQAAFPERFVEMGVAEQNMASVAAGMALVGKTVFISSYAVFSPGRNLEQIRTTVAMQNANVKIAGGHSGVSVGEDGATHQALEDIALMRSLPNMRVVYPCDSEEAEKATLAAVSIKGPVYIRLARPATPVITSKKTPFVLGTAEVFREGKDATIVASGPLVYEALLAAKKLELQNISVEVINNHTIKPLDRAAILRSVKKTGCLITVEDHQVAGGMGSSVAEMLSLNYPVPVEMIGIQDRFGESGTPEELLNSFGLSHGNIMKAVKKVIQRK